MSNISPSDYFLCLFLVFNKQIISFQTENSQPSWTKITHKVRIHKKLNDGPSCVVFKVMLMHTSAIWIKAETPRAWRWSHSNVSILLTYVKVLWTLTSGAGTH